MRLRYSTLFGVVAAWGIAGFPFLAATTAALGVPNTLPSIAMRGLVLGLAVLLLVMSGTWESLRRLRHPGMALLLIFWALYLARMLQATLFEAETLSRTPFTYWIFALGASFVPMLALSLGRSVMAGDRLFALVFVPSLVALGLATMSADTLSSSDGRGYDTGRFALESLNPIAFGQLGVTVALLAYWRIRSVQAQRRLLLMIPALAFGILGTLLSGSRGPLVALAATVLFLEAARGGVWVLVLALLAALLIGLMSFDPAAIDRMLGVQTFARVEGALSLSDPAALMRVQSFNGAWQQFLGSPLTGDGLEERTTHFYPHNIILEALMATGGPGGLALLGGALWLILCSFRLLRRGSAHGWAGLLFIQYLVAAQFSGAIYGINTFWTLAGMVIAVSFYRLGAPVDSLRPDRGPGAGPSPGLPHATGDADVLGPNRRVGGIPHPLFAPTKQALHDRRSDA